MVFRYGLEVGFEESLDAYSALELQLKAKRFLSVEQRWQRPDSVPPLRRDIPDAPSHAVHLVRGGRWLLVGSKMGAVHCYDLDTPTCHESVLIPPETRWEDQIVTSLTVCHREHSEKLNFDLLVEMAYIGEHLARDESLSRESPLFRYRTTARCPRSASGFGVESQFLWPWFGWKTYQLLPSFVQYMHASTNFYVEPKVQSCCCGRDLWT